MYVACNIVIIIVIVVGDDSLGSTATATGSTTGGHASPGPERLGQSCIGPE